jgi:hypothetical protein
MTILMLVLGCESPGEFRYKTDLPRLQGTPAVLPTHSLCAGHQGF